MLVKIYLNISLGEYISRYKGQITNLMIVSIIKLTILSWLILIMYCYICYLSRFCHKRKNGRFQIVTFDFSSRHARFSQIFAKHDLILKITIRTWCTVSHVCALIGSHGAEPDHPTALYRCCHTRGSQEYLFFFWIWYLDLIFLDLLDLF